MHAGLKTIVCAVSVVVALSGCGLVETMTGNSSQVCDETQEAFTQFGAQLKTLSPTDNAAWAQATTDFAGRLDALAKKADDKKLAGSITALSTGWRNAAPAITQSGDVATLTALLRDQPAQLGKACA